MDCEFFLSLAYSDSKFPLKGAVDVRDVAELHVKALTEPAAKNARILSVGFYAFNIDIVEISRKIFADNPEALARIPSAPGKDIRVPHYGADSTLALRVLGRPFISLEKCLKDTAERLWELERSLQK